ncbi:MULTISPECIES: hypothetical protein [unclassified Mesorhizobium]|uniref:hypothetical protein n=1 Tax=unclassified Mesorhizobium TaxID=325217 RepID=UPI00112A98DD|nr:MULTISPECIES: hypothetical protein [unclassified Mesorhizobium]TPL04183.1 hypothetical protein FJ567_04730 [Mesorhizobium sp. B2-4-16]TPL76316.1 hypothetical protein FJ956_04335 [Mesorhizobium sp. B2-4-3]
MAGEPAEPADLKAYKHLSNWQWLLLLGMTVSVVVIRHLPYLHYPNPAYLDQERIGAIYGSVIMGFLLPYGIAWGVARLARRSRNTFLAVLWTLSGLVFLLNIGLHVACPTCY